MKPGRPKLLLIDNPGVWRDQLVSALVAAGIEVKTAANGTEGLVMLIDEFFATQPASPCARRGRAPAPPWLRRPSRGP